MDLKKSGERILHKEDGLVLHHLIVMRILPLLSTVAIDNVQKHLLVLRHWLALLGKELLGFIP